MKDKTADKYLSVQSVAETLSCTDRYVYELIQTGALTAVKIGERALRISERSLQAFIAARIVNPDDYFAPKETPAPEPSPAPKKIARSNWMNR
jgi:excisionase family DNA binding protein